MPAESALRLLTPRAVRLLLLLIALLCVGCPYNPRTAEVMGPGLVDPGGLAAGQGEITVGGFGGAWRDPVQDLDDWTVGARANIDIGLTGNLSLAVDSGFRFGSGHMLIFSARAGPRLRLFDHLYLGVGVGSSLSGYASLPNLGADLELGGGGWVGPVLISANLRFGVSTVLWEAQLSDPGLYLQPEVGVALRPWSHLPVGPFVSVGGHGGWRLAGSRWGSIEVHGTAGVLGRFPEPTGVWRLKKPVEEPEPWDP